MKKSSFAKMAVGAVAVAVTTIALLGGSTYYVSPTGNDASLCTQSQPCKSITRAIAVAADGDTVVVTTGAYRENVNVNKAVALKADGPVLLDGSGLLAQSGGGIVNIPASVSGATVHGFEIANGGTYGISVFGSGNRITSNVIHNINDAGIWMRDGSNNVFEDNELYYSVLKNSVGFDGTSYTCSPSTTGWPSAINSWGNASNNTWRSNYVHDNCGEGIVAHPFDLIELNTFKNNWSVEIYIDGATDVTIRNNVVTNTRPYFARGSNQSWRQVPYGIGIADESGCTTDRNLIVGNTVSNVRYGLSFYGYASCSGLKNTVIENNTFLNSWEYGIRITSGAHANTIVRNNVISSAYGTPYTIPSGITVIWNSPATTITPVASGTFTQTLAVKTATPPTVYLSATATNYTVTPVTPSPTQTSTPTRMPTASRTPISAPTVVCMPAFSVWVCNGKP